MRLIGLDPGLRLTGWGVIDVEGNRLRHVAHGVVKVATAGTLAERLRELFDGVAGIVEAQQPLEAAVEETFVNINPGSTLKLGQARGVVMLAPARAGLPVYEYAANLVKKSVIGAGHADKHQIAMMVGRLLPGVEATSDAADALAVAICHAHHRATAKRVRGGAMIAKLKGAVDSVDTDSAIIDVGGVGYLVSASARTLRDLAVGGSVTVLIETIVREDAIALYGFLETAERDWFRILTTVQGVGARVALSILSTLSPDEIARAIAAQDRATLSRPAGVGPKLAARLATELKDKAAAFGIAPAAARPADAGGPARRRVAQRGCRLGPGQSRLRRVEAFGAVARVTQRLGAEARLDAVIRAGLQELAR